MRVSRISRFSFAMIEETEIVADIIGKLCFQACAKNVPSVARGGVVSAFQNYSRRDVAKNEMAVPIAEVEVRRANFRIDH